MASAAKKKIVVCGGNGFLETDVSFTQEAASAKPPALEAGIRSGEPTWSSVTSSPDPPPWSTSVHWAKGNILDPSSYTTHLNGADAVVHSMGILLEADYKRVLQGRESPLSGLRRAFSASKAGTQNPLERHEGQEGGRLSPQEPDGQLTYEVMNRDSAISLASESSHAGVKDFIYISAAGGAPVLPARYITTKREAESVIASEFPQMRSVFFRPGMLWDSSRLFTVPLAAATAVGAIANSLTGNRLTGLMGAGGVKPLKADLVGEAVVEAIGDESVRGPVETGEIEALATRAWRRGML
ncbi:hypothetical protein H2201_003686 [Coniosporium apollinis]|uniref:NAD-dependent epimerase/dehydratase domain-containing protein n=1 Tax=Coniosporium apollinis TaxID=61459 RepID=A0ABQ9NVX3_9PEZI|nr:hypothetical protein H2201_003686 [Coniosporium apollinis]